MNKNPQVFQQLKIQIKQIFQETKTIYSPALKENVVFNSKGINHLLYKGSRSRRSLDRINTNLRLLPRAIHLLKQSTFYQEESFYVRQGTIYHFWAFEAVVDNRRIKVVVRQVGKGKKHFWRVILAWRKTRFGILNARNTNLEK